MKLTPLAKELTKLSSPYICRSCEIRASLRILRQLRQHGSLTKRFASTVSVTAVNAERDIPRSFQNLHRALDLLRKDALSYVNISKLQLALRGLESTSPVTRIAVLGLNNQKSARSVARLLLADALSDEGAWERQLEEFAVDDRRGIILRYGDENDPPIRSTLVTTIHVPSRILQQHNLEILISSLNVTDAAVTTGSHDLQALKSAALIPTAEAPKSFSGGIQFITYPVHRSLVVAEGLPGLLKLGKYVEEQTATSTSTADVELAIELPKLAGTTYGSAAPITFLDTALARDALSTLRESTRNAALYEQGWNGSGLPAITTWFSKGSGRPIEGLAPAVEDLIKGMLDDIESGIKLEDEALTLMAVRPVFNAKPLEGALQSWADKSHAELRNDLEEAFASEKWARLKWWKLFWRVDDVTLFAAETFERNWLKTSEQGIVWLSGRAVEAGLYVDEKGDVLHNDQITEKPDEPPAPEQPAISSDKVVVQSHPWPSEIPNARHLLRNTTVPSLHALAQRLVLQTASITGLSSVVSALLYVSYPQLSVLEAGAAAALGLVWSLRRMQKLWEDGRQAWQGEIIEAGRVVLKETEQKFKLLISRGGHVEKEVEGAQDRAVARAAVGEVRRVLAEVVKQRKPDESKLF